MTETAAVVQDLEVSRYERERQEKIAENQRLLKELGLARREVLDKDIPHLSQLDSNAVRKRAKFIPKEGRPNKTLPATRISRRIKGMEPEKIAELEEVLDANDRTRQVAVNVISELQVEPKNEPVLPDDIHVPLTLASIGTTIWSLGELYVGEGRKKYWSTRGCKYKHPYPIGYKATKSHFGNNYTMTITKGDNGPVFSVQVNQSSTIFTGPTPTAPWTEACKKSKSQNTRVSGPLFYGFSDILTMHLIERMEGYDLACQPEIPEQRT